MQSYLAACREVLHFSRDSYPGFCEKIRMFGITISLVYNLDKKEKENPQHAVLIKEYHRGLHKFSSFLKMILLFNCYEYSIKSFPFCQSPYDKPLYNIKKADYS